MKSVIFNATLVAGIATLVALGGCSRSSEVQTVTKPTTEEFVSPGKGSAPVTLSHHFDAKPAVGTPLALELVLMNDHGLPMQLEISADDGLAVVPQFNRTASSGQSIVVDLLPQAEGRYYVNVIARVGTDKRGQAKVFAIPVQVGAKGVVSKATRATVSPDGERLIRMKAQDKPVE